MAFHASHRNYSLTTGVSSAYMAIPTTDANSRYLITNPSTNIQYYGISDLTTETIAAPSATASGATAVSSFGTPILAGQQVLIDRTITNTAPYFYGLSPLGASTLIVTMGSGD